MDALIAARAKIVYHGRKTLTGALLDLADNHPTVMAVEQANQAMRGAPDRPPLDTIELMVAKLLDQGQQLPIRPDQQEAFAGAQWLATGDIDVLPTPFPRAFMLHLAMAFTQAGKYPSVTAALTYILDNKGAPPPPPPL